MRWAQRGRPARSLLLAIAIRPLSVGMTAIATLAQFSKDFSFSIKAQTRSVLEILIFAMLPTSKIGENKSNMVGRKRGGCEHPIRFDGPRLGGRQQIGFSTASSGRCSRFSFPISMF